MIDRVIHTRYRYNNNATDIASIDSNVYPVQWICAHRHLSKMLSVCNTEDEDDPYYYVVLGSNYRWGNMYKTTYWDEYGRTVNI